MIYQSTTKEEGGIVLDLHTKGNAFLVWRLNCIELFPELQYLGRKT